MPPDASSLRVHIPAVPSPVLEAPLLPDTVLQNPLRGGRIDSFAARNNLRTSPLWILQKCLGIALTTVGWLVFLGGLAYLILAALHNHAEELGLGLGATATGAQLCLASFILVATGVPVWLSADRKVRARALA